MRSCRPCSPCCSLASGLVSTRFESLHAPLVAPSIRYSFPSHPCDRYRICAPICAQRRPTRPVPPPGLLDPDLDIALPYQRRARRRRLWVVHGCCWTRLHLYCASDRPQHFSTRPANPLHLLALYLEIPRSFHQRARSCDSGELPACWVGRLV